MPIMNIRVWYKYSEFFATLDLVYLIKMNYTVNDDDNQLVFLYSQAYLSMHYDYSIP